VEAITEGSKQLKTALEEGKKIIITTIQKFPYIVNEIGELPGNKFAIIIDEAHSSQSGNTAGKLNETLAKDFEKVQVDDDEFVFVDKDQYDELTSEDLVVDIVKGRKMLTNASYFAFTATPKTKHLNSLERNTTTTEKKNSELFICIQ
jgi:type I restriction enzyme R subunit